MMDALQVDRNAALQLMGIFILVQVDRKSQLRGQMIGAVLTISKDTKGELCPGNRRGIYGWRIKS